MLMRESTPSFVLPSGLNILDSSDFNLNNNIPIHLIEGGTQDVVKIDFIFSAGAIRAPKPLVASFTNYLMQEGTKSMSSMEVAEKIDFYGAFLGQSTNYHHAQLSLYALTKYLPQLLPVIEDIIKRPAFEPHEFDVYLAKRKQEYMVDSEKVKTLAYRKSQEVLFGADHPYGRVAKLYHYDDICLEDIKQFHQSRYTSKNCSIVVAGQPSKAIKELLNKHFGGNDWENKSVTEDALPLVIPEGNHFHLVEKEGAMQSAIKIVRSGVTKDHPDYIPLLVLNTIFGGYFGSRLMNNLREEKGLTYGISSYMISYIEAGVIGVTTEVLSEKREIAVQEVFNEMNRICTEVVDKEELDRVRNYMVGDLMRNLDGPFAISDAYRGLFGFDLDYNYYKKLEETIIKISAEQLKELANKYFVKDEFYVVIAGK